MPLVSSTYTLPAAWSPTCPILMVYLVLEGGKSSCRGRCLGSCQPHSSCSHVCGFPDHAGGCSQKCAGGAVEGTLHGLGLPGGGPGQGTLLWGGCCWRCSGGMRLHSAGRKPWACPGARRKAWRIQMHVDTEQLYKWVLQQCQRVQASVCSGQDPFCCSQKLCRKRGPFRLGLAGECG